MSEYSKYITICLEDNNYWLHTVENYVLKRFKNLTLQLPYYRPVVSKCHRNQDVTLSAVAVVIVDVSQMKAYDKKSFVTSSFDQSMTLWQADDGKAVSVFRGTAKQSVSLEVRQSSQCL